MKVVVATGNAHKFAEISSALAFPNWEFVMLKDIGDFPEPEETGATFLDNARIKARAACEETGMPAIADDSGLEVDALGGRPGVLSARYSGKHGDDSANNELLLFELSGVPESERTARFKSVLVFIDAAGREVDAEGTVEGRIGTQLRGEKGFGYDPLFFPDIYQGVKTMAELSMAEKNEISHRGNALRALRRKLEGSAE